MHCPWWDDAFVSSYNYNDTVLQLDELLIKLQMQFEPRVIMYPHYCCRRNAIFQFPVTVGLHYQH